MSETTASRRSWLWIFAVFLVLLTIAVYLRSLGNDFVAWDDGLLILENPIIRGPTIRNIVLAFTSYDPELYIPLTFLSYQLNYLVGGLHPFGYHLVNLLLHVANALLVAWVVSLLSKRPWAALVAGILFAIHPLHTEAVAWASARKDVLMTFFFLLSVGMYLRSHESDDRRWSIGSVIMFLFALLSKVSVIVLPGILILHRWRERRPFDRAFVMRLLPYLCLSIAFGVIALFGKRGNASLLIEKILIGAKGSLFYLQKLFLPWGFSVFYPYTDPIAFSTPDLALALIVIAILTALACLSRWWLRGNRDVSFGWGWYLLLLLPTFTNFAKGKDVLLDVYFASDRYAYAASIGILFLIGLFFDALHRRLPWLMRGILAFFVICLTFLSYRQSLVWRNSETLFSNVIAWYPNAHTAHNNLGSLYAQRGDLKRAAQEYQASLAIRPNGAAYFNLGQLYMMLQLPDRAVGMYRAALTQNPNDRDAAVNLGVILLERGDVVGAIEILEHAREVDGRFAPTFYNLGLAYERAGRQEEAMTAYRKAVELDPGSPAREKLSNE